MRALASRILVGAIALALWPAWAFAQTGTIAGVVRDTSGAVLPGVTVEASSPALIEKVKSVISDGAGNYKIIDLRPGTYTVTFTLPGFNTVKREGVQLQSDFTANINADMRVGAVEETITVTGSTPLVDVQSTATRTVMSRDVLDVLPTGRNIQAVGIMIPGTALSLGGGGALSRDVGGSGGLQQSPLNFRGSADTVQTVEGMRLNNLEANGAYSGVYWNDDSFEEISYTTGADSAEMGQAGLRINLVPRDGGNTFRSSTTLKYTRGSWQAGNLGDNLHGDLTYNPNNALTNVSVIDNIYDANTSFGGPIKKDKLWFNYTFRRNGLGKTVADSFFDKNPAPYAYEADTSRPGIDDGWILSNAGRVTWQASQKDKIAVYHDQQSKYRGHWGISSLISPEASAIEDTPLSFAHTSKWTRTQTNRLLLEAGFAMYDQEYREIYQDPVLNGGDVADSTVYAIQDQVTSKWFNAWNNPADHFSILRTFSGSASYVTGSHSMKFGASMSNGTRRTVVRYTGDLTERFASGVPNQVTLRLPLDQREGIKRDLGVYAQDRWTIRRATVNVGLRYDNFVGQVRDEDLPASRWLGPGCLLPGCTTSIPHIDGFDVQDWKDLSPRFSVAYDLFGNGRTAVKSSIGRYLQGEAASTAAANNPETTIGRTDARNWNDLDGNLSIFNADGSLQAAELGPTSNANFGKFVTSNASSDPKLLNGWFARQYSWEYQAGLQQQVTPKISANVDYYYRWLGNQTATDNLSVNNSNYDGPFCVTAPDNANLPGGGGFEACGLYDLNRDSRSLATQNYTTFADNLGGRYSHRTGIDFSGMARFGGGTFLQGGINMERLVNDTCAVDSIDSPENRFCHTVQPFRPDAKILGSYALPWQGVILTGTYQFSRGPALSASWAAPNSLLAPILGRNLSACASATGACSSTKTIQLIEPNTEYGENLNQLDIRGSKRFTINGRLRLRLDVDLYNVFNSNWPYTLNGTFSTAASSAWLRPTNVLQGRLFELGGQIDF